MNDLGANSAQILRDVYLSKHFYKSNGGPSFENTAYFESAIGRFLPADVNSQILEIGIGMGHFSFFATKTRKYVNYLGLDINEECVEYVKTHVTPKAQLCTDVVEFLKGRPSYYDAVVLIDVIEHIEKPLQFHVLQAAARALRGNGALILRTENTAAFTGYYQHTMDYTHEYNFSTTSLGQLLNGTGFNDIEMFGDYIKVTGIRSFLRYVCLQILHGILRFIYELERPGCVNPTLFSKSIYAICKK